VSVLLADGVAHFCERLGFGENFLAGSELQLPAQYFLFNSGMARHYPLILLGGYFHRITHL